LLSNNCEHFCEWCLRGQNRSYPVEQWVSVKRLRSVIVGIFVDTARWRIFSAGPQTIEPKPGTSRPGFTRGAQRDDVDRSQSASAWGDTPSRL